MREVVCIIEIFDLYFVQNTLPQDIFYNSYENYFGDPNIIVTLCKSNTEKVGRGARIVCNILFLPNANAQS